MQQVQQCNSSMAAGLHHVHSSITSAPPPPAGVLLSLVVAHDEAHAGAKALPVVYRVVLLEALRVQLPGLEGLQQGGGWRGGELTDGGGVCNAMQVNTRPYDGISVVAHGPAQCLAVRGMLWWCELGMACHLPAGAGNRQACLASCTAGQAALLPAAAPAHSCAACTHLWLWSRGVRCLRDCLCCSLGHRLGCCCRHRR